jgi:hypothetical protein
MRWAGHVARTGRRKMNTWFWWKVLKELNHFKYQDPHMRIILKFILKTEDGRTDRIHLAHDSVKRLSTASTDKNLHIP